MFVVNDAMYEELFASMVGFAEIGVFQGLPAVYGATQVLTETVHVTEAGVDVNPLLTAFTENVCDPFGRFEYDAGETHAA